MSDATRSALPPGYYYIRTEGLAVSSECNELTLVPVNDGDDRQKVCSSFSRKLFGHPNSSLVELYSGRSLGVAFARPSGWERNSSLLCPREQRIIMKLRRS